MFAPSFDYYRAGAVREALALMQQHPGAKLLAGGHSLIPLLKLRLTAADGAHRHRAHSRAEGHRVLRRHASASAR